MNRSIRYFNGLTADAKVRKFVKTCFRQAPGTEPLPISEEPRIGNCREDGECFTEYGFLPGKYSTLSDGEIEELINDMREYVTGPYDCTGQRFTMWITWHRNPGGRISYVHRLGIDV